MAFNWQTFRIRSLTAALFVIVMLTGLLWNYWSFFVLFSIIHFGCWFEYQKLVGLMDPGYQKITIFHKYGFMLAGWAITLYFTNDAFSIAGFRLHELGWWIGLVAVFLLPVLELLFNKDVRLKNVSYSLLGLIYISLIWGLMIDLRVFGMTRKGIHLYLDLFGFVLPLGLILSIWINDTMAYIVGSLIGKTPLSKISPKKTWEGTIGGILLCIVVITLVFGYWWKFFRIMDWIFISAIASITGIFGDLFESKLKRLAGVKDSGQIMPGHGGFLDRFDSLLFATPFVWLYVRLFM